MRFLREFGTGPDPAKRSRLQPERIGARGPNDPYTLSGLPLPMCYPPTCTEIYSNSLFASFKSFVLSYCRRFCFLLRVNLLYLQPTTSSSPSLPALLNSCLRPTVSSSSSIRTSIFVQVSTSGYRCNADTNAMEHLSRNYFGEKEEREW